jgi:hypothetical protein
MAAYPIRGVGVDDVASGTAAQHVRAGIAIDGIVTGATVDNITAVSGIDDIVAPARADSVITPARLDQSWQTDLGGLHHVAFRAAGDVNRQNRRLVDALASAVDGNVKETRADPADVDGVGRSRLALDVEDGTLHEDGRQEGSQLQSFHGRRAKFWHTVVHAIVGDLSPPTS